MRAALVTGCVIILLYISCAAAPADDIDDIKLLPNGTSIILSGKIAAVGGDDFRKVLPQFQAGISRGNVASSYINEASGMAASRKNANVLWVHNDSGDSARVFAMSNTGRHLGIYNFTGKSATDWEDMAIGPGPTPGQDYLYMGDIGDNNAVRSTIKVYRVAEPVVSETQTPVTVSLTDIETFTLQYENGPRDAETLMVDPINGDLYIVSKRETYSRVYRAASSELTATGTVILHQVAQLPWGWATGGEISPSGNEVIIRGSFRASVWVRPFGGSLWSAFSGTEYAVPLMSEPQGEAICYDGSERGYYTVSEYVNQPIYYFARAADQTRPCIYIQEPDRFTGIRVTVSTGDVVDLQRGSYVNVTGSMGTTPDGERQILEATVDIVNTPPATLDPLGMAGQFTGGRDLGNPADGRGQYGFAQGKGLNKVGLLVAVWGNVSYVDPDKNHIIIDAAGSSIRVDTSLIRTTAMQGNGIRVCGLFSMMLSGQERLPVIIPRSDGDITLINP